jgi:hypothetical protein
LGRKKRQRRPRRMVGAPSIINILYTWFEGVIRNSKGERLSYQRHEASPKNWSIVSMMR